MTVVLGLVIAFASFAFVRGIATGLVALRQFGAREDPRAEATSLFWRTILPTIGGAAASIVVFTPAFFIFEPPDTGERPGVVLLAIAASGLWQAGIIAWRAWRSAVKARRVIATWAEAATPLIGDPWMVPSAAIDTGLPIVATAGFLRPRVFVDRCVLRVCEPGELQVIAAHELAHITRRDNLRRFLITSCVGVSAGAVRAWRVAAERAADDEAADTPMRSVDLASALVKIAKCATPPSFEKIAISTIADGSVEHRVRRLLDARRSPAQLAAERRNRWNPVAVIGLLVVTIGLSLVPVHELLETLVNRLP